MPQANKRLNDLLHQRVAELIQQLVDFPDGLITVSYVELTGNLQEANIGVTVLPISLYGTALRQLRKESAIIAKQAAKNCLLSKVPKIFWLIDDTPERAAHLDEAIGRLD